MSDPTPHELDPEAEAEAEAEAPLQEVELIVPAPAYESLDTSEAPDETLEQQEQEVPTPEIAPDSVPAPDPATAADLQSLGDQLGQRIEALSARFDREIRAESTREKVVDRLHAELQEYKQDLLLKVLRPVFVDLIQLHDDMGKMADSLGQDDRATGILRDFQQGIEDILYRQGVEPFQAEGDAFDPKRQRAVSTVPTDDPNHNKTLASRLRKGFCSGEKVIRPELVAVYSHRS